MFIVDDWKEFETAEEVADYITENMNDDYYDDMLDDCYGEIDVCGYRYSASMALYNLDEVAYNCGRNDYYNGLASDIVYYLDNFVDGESDDFYGFTVEYREDEEGE